MYWQRDYGILEQKLSVKVHGKRWRVGMDIAVAYLKPC
jgi:hypothetical protein